MLAIHRRVTVLSSAVVASLLATTAFALPTIDGTRDAEYPGAAAIQTIETGFGDNASEWNAAYGIIDGGYLHLMLTGNLENNFNKLEIFIDSKAGGQSVFDSSGNDNAGRMDGLVFDNGFTADYHLIARRGSGQFDVDFANLGAQSASGYFNIFGGTDFGSGSTGTGVNANPILVGYNGSNNAGIGGTPGAAANPAAALAVSTGFELRIALSDLGYTGGIMNIMVGQNGGGHDFWSNQFLGGLPVGSGNLGGDGNGNFTGEGAIDFTLIPGTQYFSLREVPEPASLSLLTLPALLATRRRRA